MGAAEGIVAGSFLVFSAMLLGSLVFGRAFCGWLCPAGAIGEGVARLRDRRVNGRRINWIKYVIWGPWMGLIVFLAVRAGGLTRVQFTYQTWHGISVSSWNALVIFGIVLALVVGLALTVGRRGFCHTVCWMAPFMVLGTWIRDRLHLPGLRLAADAGACVSCGSCTRHCMMSLDVQRMVGDESMTSAECILCARCADHCPQNAISLRFMRSRR
jgi:ferredoxin-type protein NapH